MCFHTVAPITEQKRQRERQQRYYRKQNESFGANGRLVFDSELFTVNNTQRHDYDMYTPECPVHSGARQVERVVCFVDGRRGNGSTPLSAVL